MFAGSNGRDIGGDVDERRPVRGEDWDNPQQSRHPVKLHYMLYVQGNWSRPRPSPLEILVFSQ